MKIHLTTLIVHNHFKFLSPFSVKDFWCMVNFIPSQCDSLHFDEYRAASLASTIEIQGRFTTFISSIYLPLSSPP